MTPPPIATAVCEDTAFTDRWAAYVVLDGQVTSWSCSHLHHSARVAARCCPTLLREAEAWFAEETLTVTPLGASGGGEPLYEIAYARMAPEGRLASRPQTCSRRYTVPHAGAVPVA